MAVEADRNTISSFRMRRVAVSITRSVRAMNACSVLGSKTSSVVAFSRVSVTHSSRARCVIAVAFCRIQAFAVSLRRRLTVDVTANQLHDLLSHVGVGIHMLQRSPIAPDTPGYQGGRWSALKQNRSIRRQREVVGGRTIGKSNVINREPQHGSTYRVNRKQPPPQGHA